MSQSFTDHYGMTISTQQAHAAQCWQEGLDRLLSQNTGPNTKFEEAIGLDDGLALAHGGLAFWHMQRAQPAEARTSIECALACAAGITRRERQQLDIINLWIQGQGRQALTQLIVHLAEFPRDALLMRLAHLLYNRGCSSVGEANFPVAYLGLLHKSAPYCDDNWAFLAEYAWAHHETGALDEAMRLAQRSLALNPSNAVAAHSVAHVYFERGDAGTGAEVLGDWLQGFDCPASAYVHLSWHLALFELALGQYHRALERYEHNMRPYVVAKSLATLPDSASFLWRLQLYSGASASTVETPPATSLAGQPWDEVRALATPMAARPGFAFQVAHAAFALAASDDQAGLTMMLTHLQRTASQGDLFTGEMVVPLVQGIADFAQGQYARAAELLEPVCPYLVRIGGSHAQREVFEDTLVEAYLRAEQFDKAEAMLAERLARRASARDTFWLGRAQAGRGQHTQAQGSFATAAQGWRLGDTTSPEMTAFHDQYRQTTEEEAMAHHPQHQHGGGNSAEYSVTLERMNRFQEPEVRQAIADLQLPLGSYGLDVGCGVGLYALWLAAAVGPQGRVLGLEPQAERVAVAQRQVGDSRAAGQLEFRQGDGTALPLPDQSCDWVWCSDVLHHIPDPVLALKEFMRVLRPGGRIIIKESQVAQALFLPGYPDLERQLQRAEIAFNRHEAGARSFQERRQRTPESMQQAGLWTWHLRTYMVQRQAPLDAAARAYIQHTVFERNWGPRLRGLLDSRDWQERTALCDATSPHYLLTRPEYYCLYPISVFSATTAATSMSIA